MFFITFQNILVILDFVVGWPGGVGLGYASLGLRFDSSMC